MLQVSAIIHNQRQADAWVEFTKAYLDEPKKTAKETLFHNRAPEPTTSVVPPAARVEKPTPLEVAIEEKKAEQDEQPNADPFAALSAGTEPQPETTPEVLPETKAKKTRTKKAEPAAPEPEKAEEKPLTLDDIRKASTIALELIGAPTIQEALAKFNAVDDKNVLRMSALREADYALYVQYLKKKVNDAAKEWPAA